MLKKKIFMYVLVALFVAIGIGYYTKEDDGIELKVSQRSEIVSLNQEEKLVEVTEQAEVNSADQIRRFFSKGVDKFPIVETITYTSRVPWLKGRPAWIADYASFHQTSRHFIARSLNGKEDYETQKVSPGDTFNVIKKDKSIVFFLKLNLSTCLMDFFYIDKEEGHQEFVKTYRIGVGRKDSFSPSGSLTPLGTYKLGQKIAIYKPGVENYFQNKKTHMIEIFGTRWIPFSEEVENCTDSAKGYGIHGLPFIYNNEKEKYEEDLSCLGQYSSDGCIRLCEKDINELFSIIITHPTLIEITKE